jgi:hypothetical protein
VEKYIILLIVYILHIWTFGEEICWSQQTNYKENRMRPLKPIQLILSLCAAMLFFSAGCATTETGKMEPREISLLETWSGDYPVPELKRLPAGQQDTMAGYIGNAETFAPVWQAFIPNEPLPAVDFSENIVVFTRNVQFYNRTSIFKVMLKDGTAEIFAMETMSAIPIDDKVAMAMALIPRQGVRAIQASAEKIEVAPSE